MWAGKRPRVYSLTSPVSGSVLSNSSVKGSKLRAADSGTRRKSRANPRPLLYADPKLLLGLYPAHETNPVRIGTNSYLGFVNGI